jgi:cobalt transporter subunit CbtA
MAELRKIVWLALVAGVVAGMAATAAQWFTTIPLILEAERYEHPAQEAEATASTTNEPAATHAGDHEHEHDGVLVRTGSTLLFNVLTGIGFGLLLSALLTTLGAHGVGTGLALGLGGFLAVGLAPALGLPPELPGIEAAALFARQVWWVGTALASAVGLALLVFGRHKALRLVGIALLLAPHLIGAPHPHSIPAGGPPAELQRLFIVASLGSTALFWLVLGGTLGWLHARSRQSGGTTAVVPGPA